MNSFQPKKAIVAIATRKQTLRIELSFLFKIYETIHFNETINYQYFIETYNLWNEPLRDTHFEATETNEV